MLARVLDFLPRMGQFGSTNNHKGEGALRSSCSSPWSTAADALMTRLRVTLALLCLAQLVCGWLQPSALRTTPRPVAASRPPVMLATSRIHRHQQLPISHGVALLVRPLRQLFDAFLRLLRAVLSRLMPAAALRKEALDTVPRGTVTAHCEGSVANLRVVSGAATRKVPPPEMVLSYFGYGLSPFYAELPAASVAALEEASDGEVRWLQHRHARVPNGFQLAADEGRLQLLRELYDEAVAQERLRRRDTFSLWPAF